MLLIIENVYYLYFTGIRGHLVQVSVFHTRVKNQKTSRYDCDKLNLRLVYQDCNYYIYMYVYYHIITDKLNMYIYYIIGNNLYVLTMSWCILNGYFKWVESSLFGLTMMTDKSTFGRMYKLDVRYIVRFKIQQVHGYIKVKRTICHSLR